MKDSKARSSTIMADFEQNKKSTRQDVKNYKDGFEKTLKWLANSEKETAEKSKIEIDKLVSISHK